MVDSKIKVRFSFGICNLSKDLKCQEKKIRVENDRVYVYFPLVFFLQCGFFGGWPFKSVLFSVANNRNTDLILRKARMKEK